MLRLVASSFSKVSAVNRWLASRFTTTHKTILAIEITFLIGLGFTMMQIGEHLIAIMLWLVLAVLWISRICQRNLEVGNRALAIFERSAQIFLALFICSILIVITNFHRGDDLWSNLMKLWIRPPIHRHELGAKEREYFEKPLKDFKNPQMSVHLYCAPEDEVDCEYASALIPLFGEAGWDVATIVDRITLGRPKSGILIGLHGTVKLEDEPKMKWNQGEWTRVRPEEWALRQAFVNIGIEPDSTSGAIIPENQINVYVGHERDDESAPTDMTRQFEASKNSGLMNKVTGAK